MAEVVRMPKMSDTMTEGVIAKWHKKVGDKVSSGDLVAEIETDKATMDFEAFQEGSILYIGVQESQTVPVDAVIAIIGLPGEDYGDLLASSMKGGGDEQLLSKQTETHDKLTGSSNENESISQATSEAVAIRMPLLSDTMTEGVIAEWYKKIGDQVKHDDVLADVETDKATMEVSAYAEGVLLYVGVEKGQAAKVNDIIAIVGKESTDIQALLKLQEENANNVQVEKPALRDVVVKELAEPMSHPRVKASPLARKIAKEIAIDLGMIQGTAEGGRIVKKDLDQYMFQKNTQNRGPAVRADMRYPSSFAGEIKFTEKPVSQMRKVIAKRLSDSLFTSPHFYLTISIDMETAIVAREKMNERSQIKISFNDIIIKAVALALKQHPDINSSWLGGGDSIRYNQHVNIGVAVAVEDGLLVPVVRFADGKSLSQIAMEVKDFAQRAKAKKLQPSDWEGSTFTISNLGMFGIDDFTAIINPTDACILAVGGIQQVPVIKNNVVVPGHLMKVTLSCDHRVVDGAMGASFLKTLKYLLEEPIRLLV